MLSRRLLAFLALWLPAASLLAQAAAREYEVKAALLYNFTHFIEWPGEGSGEFHLCVVGRDPFGADLNALAGRPVRERTIRIERSPASLQSCELVFVPAGAPLPAPAPGMLVVAEDAAALTQGAAIVVAIEGGRMAFDINPDAAARAGLKISYKLQRLARSAR